MWERQGEQHMKQTKENHCRYKNEQLDLAEQKGGSSNIVDLTRRAIWDISSLQTVQLEF